jgi:hypothetical protein
MFFYLLDILIMIDLSSFQNVIVLLIKTPYSIIVTWQGIQSLFKWLSRLNCKTTNYWEVYQNKNDIINNWK